MRLRGFSVGFCNRADPRDKRHVVANQPKQRGMDVRFWIGLDDGCDDTCVPDASPDDGQAKRCALFSTVENIFFLRHNNDDARDTLGY
jgi:hypothetical protein